MPNPTCPICKSTKTAIMYEGLTDGNFFATTEVFDLFSCKTCEAKFQYPFIPEEVVGKYYQSATYQPFHLNTKPIQLQWKFNPQSIYLRILSEKHKKDDVFSLIDVGCGGGTFLMSVKHYFPNAKLMGVDVSETAIENLKKHKIEGFCSSLYEFDPKTKFDFITSSQVLEHLNQPYAFLETIKRLSHAETQIMIDIPASDSTSAKFFGRNWTHWDLPRHSIHFTENTLKYLFQNFKTLEIRYAGSFFAYLSSYKIKKGKSPHEAIFPFELTIFRIITQLGKFLRMNFLFDDKLIWRGNLKNN